MTLSIQQVRDAVALGNFDDQQLREIAEAIQYRRGQIVRENKRNMTIGSEVQFKASTGRTVVGAVTKINRKFIIVREKANSFNGGILPVNWRVPGSMLELV